MKNFSAHQKAEDLRISKLTLLLFLVPFLGELWPLKHWELFFGTPCSYELIRAKYLGIYNFSYVFLIYLSWFYVLSFTLLSDHIDEVVLVKAMEKLE